MNIYRFSESLYLFLIGLVSILGQVVILRELNTAFYGIELIYILSLGAWLFWSGMGALLGKRSYTPSLQAVRTLFIAAAFLPPPLIVIIRALPLVPGAIPGAYLPLSIQLLFLLLVLAPPGLGFGLLFQWTARRFVSAPNTLAGAYAVESFGGLVGGILSTLFLASGIHNFSISIITVITALAGTIISDKKTGPPLPRLPLYLLVLSCITLYYSPGWNLEMIRWRHPDLMATHDTPYGRVSITGREGQYVVFENNMLSFDTEDSGAEEIVHLAALQRPTVDSVLIFGDSVRILPEILKHAPRHVDYVDPDPVKTAFLQTRLPEPAVRSLQSPSVTLHKTDPRLFLQSGSGDNNYSKKKERNGRIKIHQRAKTRPSGFSDAGNRYDLILSGMPDPSSGAANRFFTLEFFKQCRRNLNTGGVLAFRFQSPENLWTRPVQYRNASIMKALTAVFPHVIVTSGLSYTVLASAEPLQTKPDPLIKRLHARNLQTRLISPEYIQYLLTGSRFRQTALQLQTQAIINRDRHPVCYPLSAANWLTHFVPSLINADIFSKITRFHTSKTQWYSGAAALFFLCFAFMRRSPDRKRWMLAWTAGFTGMALETLLLFYYQSVSGILFQNIGILIMAFMGGLTAGSLGVPLFCSLHNKCFRYCGPLLISGLICQSIFCLNLIHHDGLPAFPLFFLLLFFSGAVSAGLFSYAGLEGRANQEKIISPLYSADLLGGCIASLLTSLVLIPFLGMSSAIGIIIILSAAAFLLFF